MKHIITIFGNHGHSGFQLLFRDDLRSARHFQNEGLVEIRFKVTRGRRGDKPVRLLFRISQDTVVFDLCRDEEEVAYTGTLEDGKGGLETTTRTETALKWLKNCANGNSLSQGITFRDLPNPDC